MNGGEGYFSNNLSKYRKCRTGKGHYWDIKNKNVNLNCTGIVIGIFSFPRLQSNLGLTENFKARTTLLNLTFFLSGDRPAGQEEEGVPGDLGQRHRAHPEAKESRVPRSRGEALDNCYSQM